MSKDSVKKKKIPTGNTPKRKTSPTEHEQVLDPDGHRANTQLMGGPRQHPTGEKRSGGSLDGISLSVR